MASTVEVWKVDGLPMFAIVTANARENYLLFVCSNLREILSESADFY